MCLDLTATVLRNSTLISAGTVRQAQTKADAPVYSVYFNAH
jgi:hypothetical protein